MSFPEMSLRFFPASTIKKLFLDLQSVSPRFLLYRMKQRHLISEDELNLLMEVWFERLN
jgi:hypothetical protein